MLAGYNAIVQTFLGTLFTWGLTAAGAALVFVFSSGQRKVLDGSLGFAAGVMTAASFWSLLQPAIELAQNDSFYGQTWAVVPVMTGFILGALFVYLADSCLPNLGGSDPALALALTKFKEVESQSHDDSYLDMQETVMIGLSSASTLRQTPVLSRASTQARQRLAMASDSEAVIDQPQSHRHDATHATKSWRRVLLLIIAIVIHNIPEGMAVGVGFGAIGKSKTATFENARNLAIGIGLQNFPEGLAVSLPLRASGMSLYRSFWYGQLSGLVEPVAGLLGAVAVMVAEPILPYALAFAAGAMIFVVFDDIIPEAHVCTNGRLASSCAIFGFTVMMALDVGLRADIP